MNTWNIAKILVESCSSPRDVDQVIATLQDADAVREVRSLLTVFSTGKTFVSSRNTEAHTMQRTGNHDSFTMAGKSAIQKGGGDSPHRAKDATIRQLESLFRMSEMKNKQVEQWITNKFNLRVAVGKGSLRGYLAKVLDNANLNLTNQILSAAQRLKDDRVASPSDIKNYWDGLDRHFSSG